MAKETVPSKTAIDTLPVEIEGRNVEAALRENELERFFVRKRIRALFAPRWKLSDLVAFHAREKLLLLAHDRPAYDELGRLVAAAKQRPRAQVADDYERIFLAGMKKLATRGRQSNVLQHIAGHFKKRLDSADRQELTNVIESYRSGLIPLIVPITLLRHHVRRHELTYLGQQTYLAPHPAELMLRNHC